MCFSVQSKGFLLLEIIVNNKTPVIWPFPAKIITGKIFLKNLTYVSNISFESSFWDQNLIFSYMCIILINVSGSLAQIQGQSLSSVLQKGLKFYARVLVLTHHRTAGWKWLLEFCSPTFDSRQGVLTTPDQIIFWLCLGKSWEPPRVETAQALWTIFFSVALPC